MNVSIHHMLLFIMALSGILCTVFTFQYITCYSLSDGTSHLGGVAILFQYITCYSLSFRWELHSVTVFLFQYITCYSLSYFSAGQSQLRQVSIHHMLLFIRAPIGRNRHPHLFQYITCYSLSRYSVCALADSPQVSIHHMLLFIACQYALLYP